MAHRHRVSVVFVRSDGTKTSVPGADEQGCDERTGAR